MENYLPVAIEIAREAGAVLMERFDRPHEIVYKRPQDIVTEADRRSEALITSRLRDAFPGHDIVAEEGGGHLTNSEYCWYVDPLDGTTNFAHSYPVFCVSMGLARREEVIAGVIYDPTRDELWTAELGGGAFRNGMRLRVSAVEDLKEGLLATGFPPYSTDHERNMQYYMRFTEASHGVRRAGSAALDLCMVASGRFEGFWELKLNPWDKAAGVLMVTEAGGRVTNLSGEPFRLLEGEIFASNGLVHKAMIQVFSELLAPRD
ncbi:MAG: inositol monophosphatase [Acidobacteriota bacterium]|nr:inositol monophosphatase [Acidobacteriota bacterium]